MVDQKLEKYSIRNSIIWSQHTASDKRHNLILRKHPCALEFIGLNQITNEECVSNAPPPSIHSVPPSRKHSLL